jgi:hypothetical protein
MPANFLLTRFNLKMGEPRKFYGRWPPNSLIGGRLAASTTVLEVPETPALLN